MKKTLLVISIICIQLQLALACTFVPNAFCFAVNNPDTDLVVSGYITAVDTDGINIEVIQIISGVETRTNLRVWDGTDFDCNGNHSMAASDFGVVNDTIILILPQIDSMENIWDEIGDYRRPENYENTTFLMVKNNVVNGFLSGDIFNTVGALTEFDYDLFIEYWLEDNGCDRITDTETPLWQRNLKVYPNPTSNSINLTADRDFGSFRLELIDIYGDVARIEICDKDCRNVPMQHLASGMYVLRIRKENKIVYREKIIKI